jgi:hypothetical protein
MDEEALIELACRLGALLDEMKAPKDETPGGSGVRP